MGVATIVFALAGKGFREEFEVIEGRPLLLLGNEFLDKYKAVVRNNVDGRGSGDLTTRVFCQLVDSGTGDLQVDCTCA